MIPISSGPQKGNLFECNYPSYNMLVTISGPAGSGKSTAAAALATALEYDHVSGGDIFRDLAADRGLTPLELNDAAEDD